MVFSGLCFNTQSTQDIWWSGRGGYTMPAAFMTPAEEQTALQSFRSQNAELFQKKDSLLILHLTIVLFLLAAGTWASVMTPFLWAHIVLGIINAFFWFSLINVTIHHHQTHRNAAQSAGCKNFLNALYAISVPNAPKRLNRYTRAHLNHHARPFDETDVDHHFGTTHFLEMMKKPWTKLLYFLELTFVGGYVPGWEDDRYMNQVPLEQWNQKDYEAVKAVERRKALKTAAWQWGLFGVALVFLPRIAWGWAFPMLLVKNWAHFLGQFQHYDDTLRGNGRSINRRTKTYHIPGWLNYLAGGEISGHFLHHLFPEIPYYNVERARKRFVKDPECARLFAIY